MPYNIPNKVSNSENIFTNKYYIGVGRIEGPSMQKCPRCQIGNVPGTQSNLRHSPNSKSTKFTRPTSSEPQSKIVHRILLRSNLKRQFIVCRFKLVWAPICVCGWMAGVRRLCGMEEKRGGLAFQGVLSTPRLLVDGKNLKGYPYPHQIRFVETPHIFYRVALRRIEDVGCSD